MKQETVNTFNEGMNKDLNPIVTPNNLLTDNLNGTFLTYNGDELSLQNDAGNTRIPVKDTGDFVKLSEGFYPLGIKEYGGVLYIVSGKKGRDELGRPEPALDEIEFGSYPSPELASYTVFHGQKTISLNNNKDTLYKTYVINNDYFKTGRYIQFKSLLPTFNFTNVWTEWSGTGLYEVKLLLQLDNGTIDLTEDIWNMFKSYKIKNPSDTATHWLLSEDFIYHCPYSYKGKLVIQTIISEPTFVPVKYYDVETTSNGYKFKIDIKVENTSALSVVGYEIEITSDGKPFVGNVLGIDGNPTNKKRVNISSPILNIEEIVDVTNKIMHYKIIPILKHGDTEILWEDLPFEFQDKYIIKGYILLEDKFFNLGFNLEEGECYPETGEKSYKVLALAGEQGYINPSLDPLTSGEKPYIFVRFENENDTNIISKYNILGTFRVDNATRMVINVNPKSNTINLFDSVNPGLYNVILTKLNQIQIMIPDNSCSEGEITIEFSAPLDMETPYLLKNGKFTLYQSGSSNLLPYESMDGKLFKVKASLKEPLNIYFEHDTYDNIRIVIPSTELKSDYVYKIGLIVNFYKRHHSRSEGTNTTEIIFSSPGEIPDKALELATHIYSRFDTNIVNRLYLEKNENDTTYWFWNDKFFLIKDYTTGKNVFSIYIVDDDYVEIFANWYRYKIVNGIPVSTDEYLNLPGDTNLNYIKEGTEALGYLLFKKENDLLDAKIDIKNVPHYS